MGGRGAARLGLARARADGGAGPAAPGRRPSPEPVPGPPAPSGPVFDNLDPSLEHAWHPVALSRELRPGGWLQVRLLGRTWTLRRTADGLAGRPPAFGVRERLGVLWLAPAEPADVPWRCPRPTTAGSSAAGCRRCARPARPGRWPTPSSTPRTARSCTRRLGARPPEVARLRVVPEPGGFRSVQEQWCDNPLDPGVAAGGRPLRQRRRATYVYRAPFQLRLRQEFLDTGASTTLLFLLQPEDADSTRVYVCLLLSAGPGRPLPAPAAVAERGGACSSRCSRRTSAPWRALAATGLPLDVREELHVPADRLGVALRRALCDFATATADGAPP